MVEAAVIECEGSKEVLISLGLMKKWDLIHSLFPNERVSDFMIRMTNESSFQAYSSLYNFQNQIYSQSKPSKDPSKKQGILKCWGGDIVIKKN